MKGCVFSEDVLPEVYGNGIEAAEASREPLLSAQQQHALMSLVREEDPIAKRELIAHNLRLVINIAKRYSDHGVELFELVREGAQGLIHALENFELQGGFRFATYAGLCVRQSIERAIINQKNRLSIAALQIKSSVAIDQLSGQFA